MDMYFHSLPFPLFPVWSPFSAGRSGRKHFRSDRHRRHRFADLTVLPKSILFFRSLTHWLGGLGIIVIFVALFPQAGKGSARMIDAESTGPYSSRAVPRIKEMAKALFAVYLLLLFLPH